MQEMAPLSELAASRAECRSLIDRVCRLEDNLNREGNNLTLCRSELNAAKQAAERSAREAQAAQAEVSTSKSEQIATLARCSEMDSVIKHVQVTEFVI